MVISKKKKIVNCLKELANFHSLTKNYAGFRNVYLSLLGYTVLNALWGLNSTIPLYLVKPLGVKTGLTWGNSSSSPPSAVGRVSQEHTGLCVSLVALNSCRGRNKLQIRSKLSFLISFTLKTNDCGQEIVNNQTFCGSSLPSFWRRKPWSQNPHHRPGVRKTEVNKG